MRLRASDLVLASCLFHVVYATQAQSTVYRKRGHDRGDRGRRGSNARRGHACHEIHAVAVP